MSEYYEMCNNYKDEFEECSKNRNIRNVYRGIKNPLMVTELE
jgi:hypothetical protein